MKIIYKNVFINIYTAVYENTLNNCIISNLIKLSVSEILKS